MNTYLDITYSYCLSVQNSEWTNSAKHSVPLNGWLKWKTVTLFHSSDVRRPFRSQVQFDSCGCFAFSWVYWRCL